MVVFDAGGEELIWFKGGGYKGGGYKGVGWRSRRRDIATFESF